MDAEQRVVFQFPLTQRVIDCATAEVAETVREGLRESIEREVTSTAGITDIDEWTCLAANMG
jgi:hypothetical protein